MPQLNTARGEIDTGDLGVTLMHEHVFIMTTEILQNYPEAWGDESRRVADAIARLNELKSRGVDTIVDLTVLGLGRYIPRIAQIAAQTDLNIVVATGLVHLQRRADVLPLPRTRRTAGRPRDHGGHVRPRYRGGHRRHRDQGRDPEVCDRRTGRDRGCGAGVAGRRTGTPPHRSADLDAYPRGHPAWLEQQRIFAEEGVDLSRVVIGHSGDTTDLAYLEELVGNGSYIGMDRFGVDVYLPFEDRVDTVVRMCERGHADKMVLSHDASCYFDALPEETLPVVLPNWHYLHIHNDVIPALKARGVTDEQLTTMLVDNPRRIFETGGAY